MRNNKAFFQIPKIFINTKPTKMKCKKKNLYEGFKVFLML